MAEADVARRLVSEVRRLMVATSVVRGNVVTFAHDEYGEGVERMTFLERPNVAASAVVLPEGLLQRPRRRSARRRTRARHRANPDRDRSRRVCRMHADAAGRRDAPRPHPLARVSPADRDAHLGRTPAAPPDRARRAGQPRRGAPESIGATGWRRTVRRRSAATRRGSLR